MERERERNVRFFTALVWQIANLEATSSFSFLRQNGQGVAHFLLYARCTRKGLGSGKARRKILIFPCFHPGQT